MRLKENIDEEDLFLLGFKKPVDGQIAFNFTKEQLKNTYIVSTFSSPEYKILQNYQYLYVLNTTISGREYFLLIDNNRNFKFYDTLLDEYRESCTVDDIFIKLMLLNLVERIPRTYVEELTEVQNSYDEAYCKQVQQGLNIDIGNITVEGTHPEIDHMDNGIHYEGITVHNPYAGFILRPELFEDDISNFNLNRFDN